MKPNITCQVCYYLDKKWKNEREFVLIFRDYAIFKEKCPTQYQ